MGLLSAGGGTKDHVLFFSKALYSSSIAFVQLGDWKACLAVVGEALWGLLDSAEEIEEGEENICREALETWTLELPLSKLRELYGDKDAGGVGELWSKG
ncbi:hypothetical protein A2U01_0051107 [Trifolium medium]|uniref:Uncharacterized protein n=1 Tax=Trifolium medium TaxID=97028 RepID=A0A392R008_9FABA|nr:hypothetical protein [Trifolium medium]